MANGNNVSDRATRWMRWIARGIGSFIAACWGLVGIAGALYEREPWTLESAIMAGFIITSGLGILIAWRRGNHGHPRRVVQYVRILQRRSQQGLCYAGVRRAFLVGWHPVLGNLAQIKTAQRSSKQ